MVHGGGGELGVPQCFVSHSTEAVLFNILDVLTSDVMKSQSHCKYLNTNVA